MIFLRSLIFQIVFYANHIIQMVFFIIPFFLVSRDNAWKICKFWGRSNIWLHDLIIGTKFEVRGLEHLPNGGFIVACKHQSSHETLGLFPLFDEPTYILKKGLLSVPLFGTYLKKMGMIPVDRGRGRSALTSMSQGVTTAIAEQRQVLIFPEGTRRSVGSEPKYKFGIQHIYETVDAPIIPVAINTGVFWPKNGFLHYPGTVVLEIMPAIEKGLSGPEFVERLVDTIETKSEALLHEAASVANPPPLALEALAKIAARNAE